MRVLTVTDIGAALLHETAVTIGNFDGVHRGHQELLRRLISRGEANGLLPVVVTFEPHPLRVLAPSAAPSLITTMDQKLELLAAAGVPCVVIIRFTPEFADVTAESFVSEWLCDSLGMRYIVIGHDYAFGRGRNGDYRTLEFLGAERAFTVEYMEPVGEHGIVYSSSLARKMVSSGDMEGAAEVLGRFHLVAGTVVHGTERGRELGFPTANIVTENELLPPDGVYAVKVLVEGELVTGACNIGRNPTFAAEQRTFEVHLLDFNRRIYGCKIAVWFVQRLRGEEKFASSADLKAAIGKDVAQARLILNYIDHSRLQPMQRSGM